MSSFDDGSPASSSAIPSETRSIQPRLQVQIPSQVVTIPDRTQTQSPSARRQTTSGVEPGGSTSTHLVKAYPQRLQLIRGETNDSAGHSTTTQYKTPVETMPPPASDVTSESPTRIEQSQSQSQRLSAVDMDHHEAEGDDPPRQASPEQIAYHPMLPSATGFVRNPWTQEIKMSHNPYSFQLVPLRSRRSTTRHRRRQQQDESVSPNSTQKDEETGVVSTGEDRPVTPSPQFQSKNLGYNLRQVGYLLYRLLLLNLPEVYFYRVLRVYEESQPLDPDASVRTSFSEPEVSFSEAWRGFVKALMKEWKTLNLVSALLLSAIFSMFQLPSISVDSLTRSVALLSLICALISLLCGCLYIVRFGSMRRRVEANAWFSEMTKVNPYILWNGWILLSIPAVWLSWSIILFILSILCFLWRPRPKTTDDTVPFDFSLGVQLSVSLVLVLGVVYVSLVFWSFHQFDNLKQLPDTRAPSITSELRSSSRKTPHGSAPTSPHHTTSRKSSLLVELLHYPDRRRNPNLDYPPFQTVKLMDDLVDDFQTLECPQVLDDHDVRPNWMDFIRDMKSLTDDGPAVRRQNLPEFINRWNDRFFQERGIQLVLCHERPSLVAPFEGGETYLHSALLSPSSSHRTPFTPLSKSKWRYSLYAISVDLGKEAGCLHAMYSLHEELPSWMAGIPKPEGVSAILPLTGRSENAGAGHVRFG